MDELNKIEVINKEIEQIKVMQDKIRENIRASNGTLKTMKIVTGILNDWLKKQHK